MNKVRRSGKATKRIAIYMYVLIVLMCLLVVSSYTWFSLSQTPRVSDMYMFINTQSGLELSADPLAEEWTLRLDFRDLVDVETELRPVTWSERDQQFYAAKYGIDGRLLPYSSWIPLTDEYNANRDNASGYYAKMTFFARSGQAENVFLSPAVEVDEGIKGSGTYVIGTPVWNSEEIIHYNGGQGAECAVRIGIRVTPVDLNGEPTGEESTFFIYEPNSDLHPDGGRGYVPTPSIHQSGTLVPQERLILQSASQWTEADPVQRSVVIKELGEFQDKVILFSLNPGEMVMIDLYVWLEGQDMDCTNKITEAQILASIQFASDTGSQSGMQPIE